MYYISFSLIIKDYNGVADCIYSNYKIMLDVTRGITRN